MTLSSTPPSARWKAITLLVVVFLLGIIIGAASCVFVTIHRLQRAAKAPVSSIGPAEAVLNRAESRLAKELGLSPEATQAVHQELAITAQRIREIRSEMTQDSRLLARDTLKRLLPHIPESKQQKLLDSAKRHLEPWGLLDEKVSLGDLKK